MGQYRSNLAHTIPSIPLVATEGQRQSTTGNVSLYKSVLTIPLMDNNRESRPVILLDLEGEDGNIPRSLDNEVVLFLVRNEHLCLDSYNGICSTKQSSS